MNRLNPTHIRVALIGLLAVLVLTSRSPLTAAPSARVDDDRVKAQEAESHRNWLEACQLYDELFRKDRNRTEYRDAFRRCLRRHHLARRHGDDAYRKALVGMKPGEALEAYEEVLSTLIANYADRNRVAGPTLFQNGVDELRFALEEKSFLKAHLAGAVDRKEALAAFDRKLATWPTANAVTPREASREIERIADAAQDAGLATKRSAVLAVFALEFACGSCNALDEYTLLLTPGAFGLVGVGLEFVESERGVEVFRVYPKGPADLAGVQPGDRVVKIAGRPVNSAVLAAEQLLGEKKSAVELEIEPVAPGLPNRTVKLVRKNVPAPFQPSVHIEKVDDIDETMIGYLTINQFQKSTPQEVEEALLKLQTRADGRDPIRGLIVDLRGNRGGYFQSAVDVASLFLGEGVIVYANGQRKEYDGPFRSHGRRPLQMPVVVVVDGETASAAEVLAGALKELLQARVVGQTTYGKGSVQCVIPLEKAPAGIRLTVAKLSSPSSQPYTGFGVSPDPGYTRESKDALDAAKAELLLLIKQLNLMQPMANPPMMGRS